MNIEIANRLVTLRKEKKLSQEALAEKLGISRQAVSKWERAEASPDTDNLILLSRIYGMSLDDLLQTEDEIPRPEPDIVKENKNDNSSTSTDNNNYDYYKNHEYVHVGASGVHVKDKDGSEVRVGWDGIHVDDMKKHENVHIDKKGVYVNGKEYKKEDWKNYYQQEHYHFPIDMIVVLLYILIGIFYQMWGIGLLIFLLIPLIHSIISGIRHKDPNHFAYPVLITGIFLLLGFYKDMWHPGWVLFLTIPIYYSMIAYFRSMVRRHREKEEAKTHI